MGSVKRCKFCEKEIDNYSTYCEHCKITKRREIQKEYRRRVKNLKQTGIKPKKAELGNERQDAVILEFLVKKREREDKRYAV